MRKTYSGTKHLKIAQRLKLGIGNTAGAERKESGSKNKKQEQAHWVSTGYLELTNLTMN